MIGHLLGDPDEFFARQSADPSYVAPALLVLLAGVAINANTVLVLPAFSRTLSGQSETIARAVTLIGAVGGTLGVFGLWFIYAGTFHTLSVYFDGSGRFRTLFLLTGWGFAPLVLHGLLGAGAFQYALESATVPADPQQLQPFLDRLSRRSPLVVSSALRSVFLLWQALLWTFAVRHSRGLTVRQGLATVALPVLVTLAVNVRDLLATLQVV